MSNDHSIFDKTTPTGDLVKKENEIFDLYKYINPPNPLIPKNKYTESTPRSHLLLEYVKRFKGIENEEPQGSKTNSSFQEKLPSVSLHTICEAKTIVYQREDAKIYGPNIYNISKYLKNDYTGLKGFENIKPYYQPGDNDQTLVFESRFESGNLALASKVSDSEYNLLMQNDINTKGHTQWFYFRVTNTNKTLIKFNILNFTKPASLYSQGMKILIYSESENQQNNTSWFREGENIQYYQNSIRRGSGSKSYYSLSFTYNFPHKSDTVYFAYSYPYTYSDLMQDLQIIENLPFVTRKLLCYSIAGNRCDYLTVTNPSTPEEIKSRKGIVISARVHPGETVGSWMMKGVLDFITSDCDEAKDLRQKYVFKIIPMLNPDGVINGNYRCGLAGVDLNRRWKSPSKKLHPTIYASKKLIQNFACERSIDFVCDFHGHSRRKNIFTYGCNLANNPEATRILPFIISKVSPFFSYPFCSFRMQKAKEGTMRITLFKDLKIANVYTMEASLCGGDMIKEKPEMHFTTQNLMDMGKHVCQALGVYIGSQSALSETLTLNNAIEELRYNIELLTDNNSDSSGSESDPSDDNLDPNQLRNLITTPKIRTVRTSKSRKISRSDSRSRKEPEKKLTSTKPSLIKRCKECNEVSFPGHTCRDIKENKDSKDLKENKEDKNTHKGRPRYAVGNIFASAAYYNLAGKKVRDQATQTLRTDERSVGLDYDRTESKSEWNVNLSTVSIGNFEKDNESLFLTKGKSNLPILPKHTKHFMNFIIGEKIIRKPHQP
ncbi:hypothetical protein SteCoe_11195 [Stentor coeruleus]|uniref:Peptidase M14 domain-containing protein n=1 Tax=Stentor coeruleus TaxID=5963 RepID=A0A1R2CDP6_9CILI|nr:hypothetical protein SteCoe_11195 [Stentor coeruleus]